MRAWFRTIIALLAVSNLPNFAVAQQLYQDSFIRTIKAMKHSVAPVMCLRQMSAQNYNTVSQGSAFFISEKGDFITASHVVDVFQPGKPFAGCAMGVWFQSISDELGNYQAEFFKANVAECILDSGLDIARCRTVEDLTTVESGKFRPDPVAIDPDRMDDGTAVAITGFPLGNPKPITSRGYIGGYPNDLQIVIDRAAWPGGSGSPVYDYRGHVVGILEQAGEGAASGISIARSGNAISLFLKSHPLAVAK